MSMKTVGMGEVLRQLRAHGAAGLQRSAKGLFKATSAIISEAQDLCPADTFFLQQSGNVAAPEVTATGASCEGGFNASYALAVHEAYERTFSTTKNPRAQAGFLAAAIAEIGPKVPAIVAGEFFKGGGPPLLGSSGGGPSSSGPSSPTPKRPGPKRDAQGRFLKKP